MNFELAKIKLKKIEQISKVKFLKLLLYPEVLYGEINNLYFI